MAHRLDDEAGVTRALAIGIRMTPAEMSKGRYMRAPDGHEAPMSRGDALASVQDFIADEFLGGADEPEEEEDPEADEAEGDEGEEGDEPNPDTNDEAGEALEPIAAPVSWDKDADGLFEQLPRELQEKVAAREAQREKVVQSATTEAANAKRNAVAEANAMFADQQRQYASHLEQIVASQAPQAPDPTLAATDPTAYVQALAYYNAQSAQYHQMQQQAQQARDEANQRDNLTRQHELTETHRVLSEQLGEVWTDTKQRQALLTDLDTIGAELGYPAELVNQATATDLLALKRALDWKAKAEKYDKLQGTRMEAVRAAKEKPRVNKPGASPTRAEQSSRGRDAAWAKVTSTRGRDGDASAAYLESIGVKL
jgi:hypothetical protein